MILIFLTIFLSFLVADCVYLTAEISIASDHGRITREDRDFSLGMHLRAKIMSRCKIALRCAPKHDRNRHCAGKN